MSNLALEVSVNGKVVYTIGHPEWAGLGVKVDVHRMSPEAIEHYRSNPEEVPEVFGRDGIHQLYLSGHVSLPVDDELVRAEGHFYDFKELKKGDEVTIRIVESDTPDKPNPPNPNPKVRLADR